MLAALVLCLFTPTSASFLTQSSCSKALEQLVLGSYLNDTVLSKTMIQASATKLGKIGDFTSCEEACEVPGSCPPDATQHCILGTSLSLPLGLCLPGPGVCSEDDIMKIFNSTSFGNKTSGLVKEITCGYHNESELTTGPIVMISIVGALLALVIAGTFIDAMRAWRRSRILGVEAPLIEPNSTDDGGAWLREHTPFWKKLILAFSLFATTKVLLQRSASRKYKALDGIRSISLLWIILAHTYNFMLFVGKHHHQTTSLHSPYLSTSPSY